MKSPRLSVVIALCFGAAASLHAAKPTPTPKPSPTPVPLRFNGNGHHQSSGNTTTGGTISTGGTTITIGGSITVSGGNLSLGGGSLILTGNTASSGITTVGNAIVKTGAGSLTLGSGTVFGSGLTLAGGNLNTNVIGSFTLNNTVSTNTIATTTGNLTIAGILGTTASSVVLTSGASLSLTDRSALTLAGTTLGVLNATVGSGTLVLTPGTLTSVSLAGAGALVVNTAVGSSLNSLPTIVSAVSGNRTAFLGGILNSTGNVSLVYGPTIANLLGSPLDLHMGTGVGLDKFVLQISFDPAAAAALGDLQKLYLAWFNPLNGVWENAVDGNSDAGAAAHFVSGAYDPALDFNLGTYGVDTTKNVVWAVIDHNSTFGVANSDLQPAPAPEPTSAILLLAGGCAILLRRRSRS